MGKWNGKKRWQIGKTEKWQKKWEKLIVKPKREQTMLKVATLDKGHSMGQIFGPCHN